MGMPLADDLAWVRTYVSWDPPTDDQLNETYDFEWSQMVLRPNYRPAVWIRDDIVRVRAAVAEWWVRARLSAMIDDPSSFSVGGEYSESWSSNISALRERLKELQEMSPSDAEAVGRLSRVGGSDARGPTPDEVMPNSMLNYGTRGW